MLVTVLQPLLPYNFRMEEVHVGHPSPEAHGAVRRLRAVEVTLTAGAVGLVGIACGGGGTILGVAALKSKSAQTTTMGSTGPGSTNFQAQLLEYAACMR